MSAELTAGISGAIAGIGGLGLVLRFLNKKIDCIKNNTQSVTLCNERSGDIQKDLKRGQEQFDKIMKTQTDMLISMEGLTKEIKHLNGKT